MIDNIDFWMIKASWVRVRLGIWSVEFDSFKSNDDEICSTVSCLVLADRNGHRD